MNLVGPARVVLKALGRGRHLDLTRFEDRLAVVQRLEPCDLVGAFDELLADFPEQPAAVAGRTLRPRSVKRRPRRGHRRIDVGPLRRRHFGDDLFRGGVDHLDGAAACAVAPFAVDEQLFAGESW